MSSEITIPKFITRPLIQSYAGQVNFVFGDNLEKRGMGGQGAVCRGEPNCFGVPTKVRPCAHYEDAFFYDADFDGRLKPAIDEAISLIPLNLPVFIFPKIGTGFSELRDRAPKTYMYICDKLVYHFGKSEGLCYPPFPLKS